MRLISRHRLLLIVLGALVFRLALLGLVNFPGIADPNHYYNVGVRLVEGHGFTIDYIWQYNDRYAAVEHPDDYWMPLTSAIAASGMAVFGVGVHQALLPFILIGSLLPLIGYEAARLFDTSEDTRLFVAAAVALLPEFVLNSVRTDTTVPNTLLVGASVLLLTIGLRRGSRLALIGCGVAVGIAYLNRSENVLLLPAFALTLILYALAQRPIRWRYVVLIPLIAGLIALPWVLRTISINGTFSTPTTGNMFFLTDYNDHYLFDTHLTLQTYLASQTWGQIIGKRLFELAASIKITITTLDMFLPVAVIGGAWLLLRDGWRTGRDRWLLLAPTVLMLAGLFVFYPILVPFKSQGGSFKKAYLSLIPLLLPLAALALERAVADVRLRRGVMLIALLLLGLNAWDTVRLDENRNDSYLASVRSAVSVLRTLPNGDHATLMTQDPFIFSYAGVPSVVFPLADRDTVYAVAKLYGVDYLMMPPARPALDPLASGEVSDPRFVPVANVPGTNFAFYAVEDVP